jgi:hypothetical protein
MGWAAALLWACVLCLLRGGHWGTFSEVGGSPAKKARRPAGKGSVMLCLHNYLNYQLRDNIGYGLPLLSIKKTYEVFQVVPLGHAVVVVPVDGFYVYVECRCHSAGPAD